MQQFGQGFQQPRDFFTDKVIPGSPHMAVTGNGASTRGIIQLRPLENTDPNGSPSTPPKIDQPFR